MFDLQGLNRMGGSSSSAEWTYRSTDTFANISASGYFGVISRRTGGTLSLVTATLIRFIIKLL